MPDSDGETSFASLRPLTRLNAETLKPQLDMPGQLNFLKFAYHQAIIKAADLLEGPRNELAARSFLAAPLRG
jgi:hypothetical protein